MFLFVYGRTMWFVCVMSGVYAQNTPFSILNMCNYNSLLFPIVALSCLVCNLNTWFHGDAITIEA